MAILHQAQLKPSKAELLAAYLPTVDGLDVAGGEDLTAIGAYRFDDPAGEVGIETPIVSTSDGRIIHMPWTYRAEPLDGAEAWLVGTMEHSVLGPRWVYAGCGDPVYATELARTILSGGSQARLEVQTPEGVVERENTVHVQGTGKATDFPDLQYGGALRNGPETAINLGSMTLVVHHVLNSGAESSEAKSEQLRGTWPGITAPSTMASLRPE